MLTIMNKYLSGLFAVIYYGSFRNIKRKTSLASPEVHEIAKDKLFPFIYTSIFLAFIFADFVLFVFTLLGKRLNTLHPIAYACGLALLVNYIYIYHILNFDSVILEYKSKYESISNELIDFHLFKYFIWPFLLICLFFLMLVANLQIK